MEKENKSLTQIEQSQAIQSRLHEKFASYRRPAVNTVAHASPVVDLYLQQPVASYIAPELPKFPQAEVPQQVIFPELPALPEMPSVQPDKRSYWARRWAEISKNGISFKERLRSLPLFGYGLAWFNALVKLPVTRQHHTAELELLRRQNQTLRDHSTLLQHQLLQLQDQSREMHNAAQRRIDQIESYSLALRTHLQDQTRAELDASIAQEVKRVDARLHHVNTRLNPLVLLDVGQRLMKLEQLNIARKMQNFDSLLANRSANPEAYPLQNKGNAEASPNQNSKFDEDAFFRDFETTFRGSEAAIQERLKAYLPYLENMAKLQPQERPIFVDVGCGRGEWLSLMAEQGIPAIGIDLNAEKVAACLAQGHAARVADAIVYLNEQAENSLGGVTGFHIIEHLPFEKLIALFDAALRALRPGGLIIFETPNPENLIVGACDFYYDPTHLHPIVPNVAKFIATQRGFSETEIVRLNPFGEEYHLADNSPAAHSINQYLFGARDYALIARK